MPIVDSKTGKVRKSYSVAELTQAANLMRGYNLIALCAAGSGHAGGTLSIMDVTAALYLHVAQHDPENPLWKDRDRIIWSTGHKAPSLYLGLGMADNHGWLTLVLRRLVKCGKNLVHIMAVNLNHIPGKGAILIRNRVNAHYIPYPAVNLEPVLVKDTAEVIKVINARLHYRLPDLPLLMLAITCETVNPVTFFVQSGSQRNANRNRKPLTQRA